MHELSIALNILDIVQEECRKSGSEKITSVVLRVGILSGVDTEALTTCLYVASRDTLMQDADLRIEQEPGKGYCVNCRMEFDMNDILTLCPHCFQSAAELLEGQELSIREITVE